MSVCLVAIKIVPIKSADDSDRKIYMSRRLMERLGIDQRQKLQICLGKIIKAVKVDELNIPYDEIQLAIPNHIFHQSKFLVKYFPASRLLYIGPIIALVTEIHVDTEAHFGSIHTFCKELHQIITKSGGFFYVFAYRDFSEECVNGYYFDGNQWIFGQLPFPDVIYNRIHSRRSEQTKVFQDFRDRIDQLEIPMFNDRFLSKWEVYQHLMQEEDIHPFMPETRLFSQENLYDFMDQYESVFIKPVHGSQGRNIIKLAKNEEHMLLQTSLLDQPIKKCLRNEVFYQLKPFLHNRIYIIQQGISLIDFEGKTMDFRVLVHKNQERLWEVTSIVARISAEEQFVSNLARGGTIMKPLLALTACFNQKTALQLIAQIKKLSIESAVIISRNTNGITGELGIDIGVDDSGDPWIIEVNSKPSKNFEDSLTKIRPSAKAIIHFCTKLAFDGVSEMEE